MALPKLTDYERKRLENIRRNDEMMASLKIHSRATELSASSKRQRVGTKSFNVKSEKKPKPETPIVIRRSLRTSGMPPDSNGLDGEATDSVKIEPSVKMKPSVKILGPLAMKDAYGGTESDRSFIEGIVGMAKKESHFRAEEFGISKDGNVLNDTKDASGVGVFSDVEKSKENKVRASFKLGSLYLDSENIARIVPGRISAMRFLPSSSLKMVVAGNKFGNIGFWGVGDGRDGGNKVYLYRPHPAPISGILVQGHCLSKIYTSCYDGFIRMMDAEKEIFDLVFSSDEYIYALSQPKSEANCLYFGEGRGALTIWDNRVGKCSSHWVLHEDRINTIDFNPENPHIVATGSTDGTACTWDLRYTDGDKLALRTFTHKRAVQSAYFSPSGCTLATTSMDNTIGIYSGVNFEDAVTVYHYNQTGRWLSTFRAVWGWDDSHLFVGNMKRGVDVVSAVHRKTVMTLQSPQMTAIPCRFDAHPYLIGTLAGATSGGQVYIWMSH